MSVSISVSNYYNSCHSKFEFPTVLCNSSSKGIIIFWKWSPDQGAKLKLKFHLILLAFGKWSRLSNLLVFLIQLEAANNVLVLLEEFVLDYPRLAMNNFVNARMSSFFISSCISFRCIGYAQLQAKNRICDFFFDFFLSAIRDWTYEICATDLKWPWSCSFFNWQLALRSFCYLSQPTAQKMKFSIKYFVSKMENFNFFCHSLGIQHFSLKFLQFFFLI